MRWGRYHRSGRTLRPKVRTLSDEEKACILATMSRAIEASPVLTSLGVRIRWQRGRLYLERSLGAGDSAEIRPWGRITPLADSNELLLEQERGKGNWSGIDRGSAERLIETVAGDTRGTFHALGALDKALRQAGKGLERLPIRLEGNTIVYADTGVACTPQEVMFHECGVPPGVLVEPSEWYAYHRTPMIAEWSEDGTRVLVRFQSMSWSGASFGGTCLYARRDGRWGAYRIRPSEGRTIASAETWLTKRKWRPW